MTLRYKQNADTRYCTLGSLSIQTDENPRISLITYFLHNFITTIIGNGIKGIIKYSCESYKQLYTMSTN